MVNNIKEYQLNCPFLEYALLPSFVFNIMTLPTYGYLHSSVGVIKCHYFSFSSSLYYDIESKVLCKQRKTEIAALTQCSTVQYNKLDNETKLLLAEIIQDNINFKWTDKELMTRGRIDCSDLNFIAILCHI